MKVGVKYIFCFACVFFGQIHSWMYVGQVEDGFTTLFMETSPNVFPFHAIISSRYICTGIVITEEYVLCPAQCVNGSTWANVYLGSKSLGDAFVHNFYEFTSLPKESVGRHTHDIIIHENFTKIEKNVYLNNVALLKLSDKVPFRDNIQPGRFMSAEEYESSNESVYATGWYIEHDANLSLTTAKKYDLDTCASIYEEYVLGQIACLKWKHIDHRLDLTGNPITSNGKILGYILLYTCEVPECEGYTKFVVLHPFLDWISEKIGEDISYLTGRNMDRLDVVWKLDRLGQLLEQIKLKGFDRSKRLKDLEYGLPEIYKEVKSLKTSLLSNTCMNRL